LHTYLCMHARMHAGIFVCTHLLSMCVRMLEYMRTCMHAGMHVCTYACMHVCIQACMHVRLYACMYVCMHACMHACMHVYMYIQVCMYTCIYKYACIVHALMHASMHLCIMHASIWLKRLFGAPSHARVSQQQNKNSAVSSLQVLCPTRQKWWVSATPLCLLLLELSQHTSIRLPPSDMPSSRRP
jgi:hypothetical protein